MKKFLLSVFLAVFAFGLKAETQVVFDFDKDATALFGIEGRSSGSNDTYVADGEFKEDGVATLDGVTVTVQASREDATTKNRLWKTSPVLRMYNGTLSVSAPDHKITKIVFSADSKNFNIASVNVGEMDEKTWISSSAVSEVVFTISKNTQIKSMTVTLDGEIGEEPEPVVIAGTGEGTAESPYDVERALSIIANDKVSTAEVYVAGKITNIEEINLEYGNATYTISQGEKSIKIYRGYYLKGEKFTATDQIKVDDAVVVCGKLITNYGGQITTGSKIYSLNGQIATEEPEEPYVAVGNGTKENPYTVADVIGLNILESDKVEYWVKGYILGSASSATKLNEADKAVDTNIALGATADATTFIPVALPATPEGLRAALGVATNPSNIGKEVMVYGTLEKYFSVAGVKNVSDFILDGNEFSGISSASTDNAPVKYYNIQGVEVANPQPGQLYIRIQGAKATKVIK